jgi:hypothetical protein
MIYISLKKTIGKLKIEKKNNKMKNKKKNNNKKIKIIIK